MCNSYFGSETFENHHKNLICSKINFKVPMIRSMENWRKHQRNADYRITAEDFLEFHLFDVGKQKQ